VAALAVAALSFDVIESGFAEPAAFAALTVGLAKSDDAASLK
jgi:hypothetical protein